MSPKALQQIASKLLAQALTEVFPGCLLVEGSFSNVLFHYDALLPHIDKKMLCLVEEKMRGLIKTHPELRVTEMMRQNAAAYFHHHEQPIIAENIEELPDQIVPILALGNFKDYCDPDFIPQEWAPFFFELLEIETHKIGEESITRITGSAHLKKDSLKAFVKKYKNGRKLDYKKLGIELEIFTQLSPTQWTWLPRGEELKNQFKLINLKSIHVDIPQDLTPELLGLNPKKIFDPAAAWHLWLFQQTPQPSLKLTSFIQKTHPLSPSQLNGLITNSCYTTDLTHIFCLDKKVEKELIYYLQLLDKIIKIFRFEVQWILRTERPHSSVNAKDWDDGVKALVSTVQTLGLNVEIVKAQGANKGPRLEALIHDAFGQQWNGPFIGIDCCHPKMMKPLYKENSHHKLPPKIIALSAWGSFERFIALLIENHQGMLLWPNFLQEVQKQMNSINEESVSSIES